MTIIPEKMKMNKNVSNHELALRSRQVLDLGPRQARLIFLAGVAGIVLVVVASLTGNQPQTIGVDKLLHFGGYATLAAIFVLSLPPRWYLPALLMLAGSGLLIELLQPLNLRTFDLTVDLREAWKSIASLEQATDEAAPPKMKKELAKLKYGRSESPRKAKADVNQSVGPARVLATSERIPAN